MKVANFCSDPVRPGELNKNTGSGHHNKKSQLDRYSIYFDLLDSYSAEVAEDTLSYIMPAAAAQR